MIACSQTTYGVTVFGLFLDLCRVVVKKSWPAPRDLSHRIPGDDRADDGQGEQVNSSSSSTRFPELRSDPDAGFWLSVQSTIPDGVRSLLIYHLHSLFRLAGKG